MVTIKEWLNSGQDYETGLSLLMKKSHNRALILFLTKKRNKAKLVYELRKLAGIKKPVPKQVKKINTDSVPGIEEGVHRLKVIRGKRKIDYEDLPLDLQKLWDANRDAYKEIRSLHEKLKLMLNATAEDRKPLTQRIVVLDNMIRANFDIIDAYDPSADNAKSEGLDTSQLSHKRINANRKYLSVWLRKINAESYSEKKYNKIVSELKVRYNELVNAGEIFEEKTHDLIKKLNIIE